MLFIFRLNHYLGAKFLKAYKADISSFILSKAVISAESSLETPFKN
jgi:hypothetical protein